MNRPVPRLHPRVRGFDRAADAYERGRPGYAPAAVRHLVGELGLGAGRTVVELGSGTGKLTRALVRSGAAIVAVEPTVGMRRVFRRELPSTVVVDGTAERIPLPDGFADAVVAAQAFQWFRTGPALREIGRVLRPGGAIGLLWNVRRSSTSLARRLDRLLDRVSREAPEPHRFGWRERWGRATRGGRSSFGRLRRRSFPHVQLASRSVIVQRTLSESAVATRRPGRRRAIVAEVRAILADELGRSTRPAHIPYRTDVYVARRLR
jgi:SAM-dependent methyltransferase